METINDTTTVNVTRSMATRLNKDKYNLGLKTVNEVIERLYRIVMEVKNGNKQ